MMQKPPQLGGFFVWFALAELLKLPSKKASTALNVNMTMGGDITPYFTHNAI
jgi:hypothetical protein